MPPTNCHDCKLTKGNLQGLTTEHGAIMIKVLIFRIIVLIVIAIGIMSYLASLNGIDIRQFVPTFERPQLPNLKLPTMPDLKLPVGGDEEMQPATVSKIYKWRGDDGSWHFSEELPEGVTAEKVIFLNSETNVVESLPGLNKAKSPITALDDQPAEQQPAQPVNLNPYSKKAIDKLLNDARGVQELMDQRNRALEQAIQNQ
jgi:hypothetical protein